MEKRLKKSGTDSSVHGVCGGIAEHFGISSFAVRLIFIFIPIPANLIIYLILSNTMEDATPALKLKKGGFNR